MVCFCEVYISLLILIILSRERNLPVGLSSWLLYLTDEDWIAQYGTFVRPRGGGTPLIVESHDCRTEYISLASSPSKSSSAIHR